MTCLVAQLYTLVHVCIKFNITSYLLYLSDRQQRYNSAANVRIFLDHSPSPYVALFSLLISHVITIDISMRALLLILTRYNKLIWSVKINITNNSTTHRHTTASSWVIMSLMTNYLIFFILFRSSRSSFFFFSLK